MKMSSSMQDQDTKPSEYYRHQRREMLGYIPAAARTILEVGCGSGDFGAMLKNERHAEVWGIELASTAAERAAQRLDRVLACNIEADDVPLPEGYFDCIVCNDVLEHLVDPWRVLRRFRANLKQEGLIVASIPNVRFYLLLRDLLLRKRWEYRDQGVLDKTHLRFFTDGTIREMFESSGYQVLAIEGINAYDFSWKFRLLNRMLLNRLDDMRFEQYTCVAQRRS